jgi:peptidoglycan/xylan/chitin deacetylase (PgdA/CDA1 family)
LRLEERIVLSKTSNSSGKRFVVSVDFDGWSSLLSYYSVPHNPEIADSLVNEEDGVTILLEEFKKRNVKATFFVPGEMVRRHPRKIREIAEAGHEVGGHGFYHGRDECLLSKPEQKSLIEKTTTLIEETTGTRPLGFRAPCLRANIATLEVLNELGYFYDSSFLPMLLPGAYGSLSFKLKPYYPLPWTSGLLEIPVSTNPILPFPFSGSWLRNLGSSWAKYGARFLLDLNCPVSFYVHPRDVLDLPVTLGVPWHVYHNTGKSCVEILDSLLERLNRLGAKSVRAIDLAREDSK